MSERAYRVPSSFPFWLIAPGRAGEDQFVADALAYYRHINAPKWMPVMEEWPTLPDPPDVPRGATKWESRASVIFEDDLRVIEGTGEEFDRPAHRRTHPTHWDSFVEVERGDWW